VLNASPSSFGRNFGPRNANGSAEDLPNPRRSAGRRGGALQLQMRIALFPLVPVRNGALRGGICTLGLWELEVELVGSVLPPGRSEGAWPLALFTRLQLARGSKIGGMTTFYQSTVQTTRTPEGHCPF
jgi:hypothetical protein